MYVECSPHKYYFCTLNKHTTKRTTNEYPETHNIGPYFGI